MQDIEWFHRSLHVTWQSMLWVFECQFELNLFVDRLRRNRDFLGGFRGEWREGGYAQHGHQKNQIKVQTFMYYYVLPIILLSEIVINIMENENGNECCGFNIAFQHWKLYWWLISQIETGIACEQTPQISGMQGKRSKHWTICSPQISWAINSHRSMNILLDE